MITPSWLGKAAIALAFLAEASRASAAPNNIILFIGDGMGFAHVKAGRAYVTGSSATELALEQLGYAGQAITTLPNGAVTDSATAGTALATGYQHPANGIISMDSNKGIKTTILELARGKGYRTGIVTTDEIGGATPGAFGAHEPDRSLTADIRYDYFFTDTTYSHAASLPNILLGGGYNDQTVVPGTSVTLVGGASALGYTFVATHAALDDVWSGNVFGLFGSSWAPMTGMAYRSAGSTEPTLSEMVAKALTLLQGSSGVFLMVEGANIDKFSHNNDKNFVAEVAELNRAVQVAEQWAADSVATAGLPTLILITADHETGGLSVSDQTIAPDTIPSMSFSSTGHTTANVPVFSTWPPTLNGQTIDNTETFFLLEDFLNGGKPPMLTALSVSGVTETSATVQWSTVEPSDSHVEIGGQVYGTATRVTAHSVTCSELTAGTAYTLTAISRDLCGFEGSATASFTTKVGNANAIVVGEPSVTRGSVSGSYLGVLAANDGSRQTITESPDGTGSSLTAEYLLRTSTPMVQVGSVTIQGNITWTQSDGSIDNLIIELWSAAQGWQAIQLPFTLYAGSDCIDDSGNVRVRFHDSSSVRREKKDTVGIDYLVGIIGKTSATKPDSPANLSALASSSSVELSWSNVGDEDGYQIFRGDELIASVPADTIRFTDTSATPHTSYTYAVQACNSVGCSAKIFVNLRTELAAPANLTAASVKGAVRLSWSNPNPVSVSGQVYRDAVPDGDFETLIATVESGSTSYLDTSAPKGILSYYKVRAATVDGLSAYSAAVAGKPR